MSDITHIVKSYEDELQSLNDNLIEVKVRITGEKIMVKTDEIIDFIKNN